MYLFVEFERVEDAAFRYAREYLYANYGLAQHNRAEYAPYIYNYRQRPRSPGVSSDTTEEFVYDVRSPSPALQMGIPRSPSPEIIEVVALDGDNVEEPVEQFEEGQRIDPDLVLEDDDDEGVVADANADEPICRICNDSVFNRQPSVLRRCGHLFCGECITKWFDIRHTCPYCRTTVPNIVRDVIRIYM